MTQKEMVEIIGDQIVLILEKQELCMNIELPIGKPRRKINEVKLEDLVTRYVMEKTGIKLFLYYNLFVAMESSSLGTYKIICHSDRILDLIFSDYTDLFGRVDCGGYFCLNKIKVFKEYTSQNYDIPMKSFNDIPLNKIEYVQSMIQKDLDYEDITLIPIKRKKTDKKTNLFILRIF